MFTSVSVSPMCIHYEIEIINCRCIFHVLCIFAGLSLWKTSYTLILAFSDKPTLLWCFYNSKSINLGWGPSYHSGSHHLHTKLGSLAWIWRTSDISEPGTTVFYGIRAASRLSFWMIFLSPTLTIGQWWTTKGFCSLTTEGENVL